MFTIIYCRYLWIYLENIFTTWISCEQFVVNIYYLTSTLIQCLLVIWQFLYWATLHLTKTFHIQSIVKNQIQHIFCYYLSFCLNSLWQMKVNLDYFRAQINISGTFLIAQAAQVIAIFWPRFSLQTQVSTTFFTWSFTLLCKVPMGYEGVVTVHSRNGFIAAKHIY